jgi:hypothetical protein
MAKREGLWGIKSVTTRGGVYDCGAGKAMWLEESRLEGLGCGNRLTIPVAPGFELLASGQKPRARSRVTKLTAPFCQIETSDLTDDSSAS